MNFTVSTKLFGEYAILIVLLKEKTMYMTEYNALPWEIILIKGHLFHISGDHDIK